LRLSAVTPFDHAVFEDPRLAVRGARGRSMVNGRNIEGQSLPSAKTQPSADRRSPPFNRMATKLRRRSRQRGVEAERGIQGPGSSRHQLHKQDGNPRFHRLASEARR